MEARRPGGLGIEVVALVLAAAAGAACYQSNPPCWAEGADYVPDVLLLRFRDEVPASEWSAFLAEHSLTVDFCDPSSPGYCIVRVTPGTDLCAAMDEIRGAEQIEYVTPDALLYIDPPSGIASGRLRASCGTGGEYRGETDGCEVDAECQDGWTCSVVQCCEECGESWPVTYCLPSDAWLADQGFRDCEPFDASSVCGFY